MNYSKLYLLEENNSKEKSFNEISKLLGVDEMLMVT